MAEALSKSPVRKKRPGSTRTTPTTQAEGQVEVAAKIKPLDVAYIPDAEIVQRYIGRSFDFGDGKSKSDMDVYDYCFDSGMNLLLEGPTGPGKTMATRTWAASRNKMLARIPSQVGIDASQLFGRFVPDGPGRYKWVDGPVTHVFRYGGVILWNEINFTPERIASVMFGALDDNREIVLLDHESEVIRAHRGAGRCWCDMADCDDLRVLIVADMNPDYLGTRDLNAALRNRFAMQLDWDYDTKVEAQLVSCPSLILLAQAIRTQAKQQGFETPISTNMLVEFERVARDLSVKFAIANLVNHFRAEERDPIRLVAQGFEAKIKQDLIPPKPVEPPKPEPGEEWFADDDVTQWVFTDEELGA